jgi:hypothetical protein
MGMMTNDQLLEYFMTEPTYWRVLAEGCELFPPVPDCPLRVAVSIMAGRAGRHPDKCKPTVEYRSRLVSEQLWASDKLRNVNPPEWQAEFPWMLPLALADGTFECAPQKVWARAYACNRPDCNVERIGLVLDEFARVGAIERKPDEQDHMWGLFIGSAPYLPTAAYIKAHRLKIGRGDLFNIPEATVQLQRSARATIAYRKRKASAATAELQQSDDRGSGSGSGSGTGTEGGEGKETPASHPENEGGLSGVPSQSKSFPPKSKSKTEYDRWIEFVTSEEADLPDSMKHAMPTEEERRAVLAQLNAIVLTEMNITNGATKSEYLGQAISDWEEMQSPPISTLSYGRWKRWLETGNPND